MLYKIVLTTALASTIFVGCARANAADSAITIRTPQADPQTTAAELDALSNEESPHSAENGYEALKQIVALFADAVYRRNVDGQTQEIAFRLRKPRKLEPGRRYPLVVLFHGHGESDDDNTRQLSHMQYGVKSLVGPEAVDAYVLATQCPKDCAEWDSAANRYGTAPLDYTLEIIDALEKEEPIAKDEIVGLGVCSGANALAKLAKSRPNVFRAIALCGYAPSRGKDDDFPVPAWAFNNTEDDVAPIADVRAAVADAKARGERVYLSERQGAHDSWSKALRDDRVLAWLAANASASVLPPPPGRKVVVARSARRAALELGAPILALAAIFALEGIWERRRKGLASISPENGKGA